MGEMPDQFYQQVSESMKLVFDLTSRIDERVKMLVEQHGDASHRIEKLIEKIENLTGRLTVLENKDSNHSNTEDIHEMRKAIQLLEIKSASLESDSAQHENKWKIASDFVFKVITMFIGGLIAWKLK